LALVIAFVKYQLAILVLKQWHPALVYFIALDWN
jgi:hypothetical protein